MRPAVPAVAAAALLVLAGCAGVDPMPEPAPGPAPGTTEATPYPPGVTAEGLEDADALLRAHRESVRERGVVTDLTMNMTGRGDGDARSVAIEERWWASAGLERVRQVWRQNWTSAVGTAGRKRVELYANESAVATREYVDGNATTTVEPRDDSADERLLAQASTSQLLEYVFDDGNFTVVDVERRGGHTVTTLEAYDETLTDDGRAVFAATVEVTASGRVRSLSVTHDRHANSPGGDWTMRATLSDGTAVDPPEWAADRSARQADRSARR
jgi:hypothetical protein